MLQFNSDVLRRDGWKVSVERLNAMELRGHAGITVSGIPDIVAVKDGRVRIEDCKTGAPYPWHRLQVLIYMLLLPATRPRYKGMAIEGHLFYKDSTEDVRLDEAALDDDFRAFFRQTVYRVGGQTPPEAVPSPAECRWCPIGPTDCRERIPSGQEPATAEHDLF
jgi:hypothetical protein